MTRARDVANVLSTATSLATDTETAAAISSHNSATTSVHGISNTATLATQTYADSAVSTHAAAADPHTVYLKESDFWTSGKNKIINSDFAINQRAFSSYLLGGNLTYGFDRFAGSSNTGTVTMSAQTFTPGTAPVAGYEGKNFLRIDSTGQGGTLAYSIISHLIEDVRTFANQTITVSFWAKSNSGTPSVALEIGQSFGSGGSPSALALTPGGKVAITTSWARYSLTVAVPSISGKTIGTTQSGNFSINLWTSAGTDFNVRASSLGIQTNAIDFWGIQAEVGSVATPFTTATGNPASELAACQRYYYRITSQSNYGYLTGPSATASTNGTLCPLYLPVTMRTIPTLLEYANIRLDDAYSLAFGITTATIQTTQSTPQILNINVSAPSQTVVGRWYLISANNNTNAYIGVGAEL